MANDTLNGFAVALTLHNGGWQTIRVSRLTNAWLVTIRDKGGEYERMFSYDGQVREYLMGRLETAREHHTL